MHRLLKVLLLAACFAVTACGWHLRGWQTPISVTEVDLQPQERYAPLTLALEDALQQRGINNTSEANIHLQLGRETLNKRTVAVTPIGSPAQYELSLSVEYRYWRNAVEPTTPSVVTAFRVFDFDPSNTVAKTVEENTLLEEMRRELAHRILQNTPN